MYGFTYNGISSSLYGCYLAEDASDIWRPDAAFTVYDEDPAWHDGGYYYGNKVKARTFTLNCYYEDITIETREKIRRWLGRSTKGQLIFDDRPFAYYNVRVTKATSGNMYVSGDGIYSGTFEVEFTAYEPFGYLTRKSGIVTPDDGANAYTSLISSTKMPAAPTTASRSFDVYNAGTERCGLYLKIAGSSSHRIMFINNTNGTSMILNMDILPSSTTVDINGDSGIVKAYPTATPANTNFGFQYHDSGYIALEPAEIERNIAYTISSKDGLRLVMKIPSFPITDSLLGKNIIFSGYPFSIKITSINYTIGALTCTSTNSVSSIATSGTCDICRINNIQILEESTADVWVAPTTLSISSIETDYKPKIN